MVEARRTVCSLAFLLFLTTFAHAFPFFPTIPQYPLVGKPKTHFNSSKFDESISEFVSSRSLPALSVALTYDDRLIYTSAVGFADVSGHEELTTSHRFRLASVSKTVTAIAIMFLIQNGNLTLDDTVFGEEGVLGHRYGYLPYSEFDTEITVQHLLEHTIGYVNEDMCGKECDPTYLQELIDLDQWQLVGALLDRYNGTKKPGTYASYSNFGYFILGRVVEAASGVTPYQDFVQSEILQRLGIHDMRIARDERRKSEVVYYDQKNVTAPYGFHVERRDSVGAWIATPTDLVRLMSAVDGLKARPDLLKASTLEMMFNPSPVRDADWDTRYGKGWTVVSEDGKVVQAHKDGGYPGTNSWIEIDFTKKTNFAIVANTELPKNESLGFDGARDMKKLMDDLIAEVDVWPDRDQFN